ncbi:YbfB/YjiJ family MFS transporter [Nocardia sp. NPDC052566]|uniref:YbfB/YjiJ family MFS transporter n=1 Tax=Nocardia sp. NPDC052566 TaxID=3364330 RepID=UPI0037C8DDB9
MSTVALAPPSRSTLIDAFTAGAGMGAAIGVGRFAYTPLLPVMIDAHRFTASDGAVIATANYAGYLIGAVLLARRPDLNNRNTFRIAAAALIVSQLLMAVPGPTPLAMALRLIAGIASALIFLGCASAAAKLAGRVAGIAFGGVGFGIAMTGLLVLLLRPLLSWQWLWLVAAAVTAALLLPTLRLDITPGKRAENAGPATSVRAWRALLASYFLEGLGYIVIGTFLAAAVAEQRGAAVGSAVWIVVGIAAAPATVLAGPVMQRWSPSAALIAALIAQCVGAALPAVSTEVWATTLAAALFGATFLPIVMLTMRVGAELSDGSTAARLTAVYGVGQMLGPLVVAPVVGDGYPIAFTIATVVLAAAALAAVIVDRGVRSLRGPSLQR